MLDLKAIRPDPERFKAALARRGAAEQVDELLTLDARRRELLPEIEQGRAAQNEASRATKGKKPDPRHARRAAGAVQPDQGAAERALGG